MRKYLAFALLGILTLMGAGFAALGAVQSSNGIDLGQAVTNTLKASNYSEVLVQKSPRGNQTVRVVFQAPDRLSATITAAGRMKYLYIIGTNEYESKIQPVGAPPPKVFYTQKTTGAVANDPAQTYLRYYNKGPATRNGSVTTVTLPQAGQTATLTYTVTGNYVSRFTAAAPGVNYDLAISAVGSSPPVELPKGYKITAVIPSQG